MENNNNSKQVVLSIVGIAILVIAVVGVSFAFFTYSRTGTSNNIITTGSITFALEDQEPQIKATDAFPLTTNEEIASAPSTNFEVTGSLPAGAAGVTYKVYAIKGTAPTEPANPQSDTSRTWDPFDDDEISLGLSVSGDTESAVTIVSDYKYDGTSSYGGSIPGFTTDTKDGKGTQGLLLATGTLAGGKSIDHTFTIKMWINNSVTISDTDYSKTYRASDTKKGDSPLPYDNTDDADNSKNLTQDKEADDREVYSDHYYAIKIMVVASDDPSFQG